MDEEMADGGHDLRGVWHFFGDQRVGHAHAAITIIHATPSRSFDGEKRLYSSKLRGILFSIHNHVHPISQSLTRTAQHQPRCSIVFQHSLEVDLPPNRQGCDAHPRDPLRCRGSSRHRRRIGVIGSTPRSRSSVSLASPTDFDRYRQNFGKHSREHVTVGFKPRLAP